MIDDFSSTMVEWRYGGHRAEISRSGIMRARDPLQALRTLAEKDRLRVLFYAGRAEFFDFDDLGGEDGSVLQLVRGFAHERALLICEDRFDIAIVANSLMSEHLAHMIIRERNLADVVVSWTLDNHHHPDLNRMMTGGSDIVLPAHDFAVDAFNGIGRPLGRSFALATGQWTRSLAMRHTNLGARSNALYGGYIDWSVGSRGELLRACIAADPTSALSLIDPNHRGAYFDANGVDRFTDWSAFKTHLALPLLRDLSCRLFDSLLCGQVPLAPRDCPDLDVTIPPAMQEALPIIRFEEDTPDAIAAAHARAIVRFDADGAEGILRRRDFAIRHHHIAVRLGEMVSYLHDQARQGAPSTIACDDMGMRWLLGSASIGEISTT